MDILTALMAWYQQQCVDDWHESYGVKIETLDNPGWLVTIDLTLTSLENRDIEEVEELRSEDDWIYIARQGNLFQGAGGPKNLQEILSVFVRYIS